MSASHRYKPRRRGGRPELVFIVGAVALFAAVVAGLSWSRPVRVAEPISYTQTGQLSYHAATGSSSVYGRAGLVTGDPIYASVVHKVTFDYTYLFNSSASANVAGTEQLVATITNGQGLARTIPLQPSRVFSGTHFVATGSLDLASLQVDANAFDRATIAGAAGTYDVSIAPSISVHGRLGRAQLITGFDRPVTFTYVAGSGSVAANLLPGATTQTGSSGFSKGASALAASLFTSDAPGSVDLPNGRMATLLFGLSVAKARLISLSVLALALLIGLLFGRPLYKEATSDDEQVRIATLYGSSLVEAENLPDHRGMAVVDLSSFDALRQVARQLGCPILHRAKWLGGLDDGDSYAVVDSGTLYRYSAYRPSAGPRRLELESRAIGAHSSRRRSTDGAASYEIADFVGVEAGGPDASLNGSH